jgi:phosphoglycolate phosphatase
MKIGVLFDMDGTVLDTIQDLTDSTNAALAHFGYPARTVKEVCSFIGNGAWRLIRGAVPEAVTDARVDEVLAYYQQYYKAHCQIKTKPYDGILEGMADLNGEFALAIVSNKPDAAVKALADQYFPGMFALGETPDCPRKPAPDMVYRAMKALGVEKCIYVGDTEVDVMTAKNAGVPCLSVTWGFRELSQLEAAGAKYYCHEIQKLPAMIRKIAGEVYGQ